jgi:hypothetical protein
VVRELLQNLYDQADLGHDAKIDFRKKGGRGVLVMRNGGQVLRKHLLLGGTDKRDDSRTRGQFGEGLKLGIAVALNLGMEITIHAGDEKWTPAIEYAEEFGAQCIVVTTRKVKDIGDNTEIELVGLDCGDWDAIQQRVLMLQDSDEMGIVGTSHGRVLMAEEYAGRLFVRGLYVCALDEPGGSKWAYGYDLYNVSLDRDRNIPDRWELRVQVREVLEAAIGDESIGENGLLAILSSDSAESVEVFAKLPEYESANAAHRSMAKLFEAMHGADSVPCTTDAERLQAEAYGLVGVLVEKGLRTVVEKARGTFDSRLAAKGTTPNRVWDWSELTDPEVHTLMWALETVAAAKTTKRCGNLMKLGFVRVVDFQSNKLHGTYSVSGICLARHLLKDKRSVLNTLVHEVGHWVGGADGTVQHRDNMMKIMEDIIVDGAKEGGNR